MTDAQCEKPEGLAEVIRLVKRNIPETHAPVCPIADKAGNDEWIAETAQELVKLGWAEEVARKVAGEYGADQLVVDNLSPDAAAWAICDEGPAPPAPVRLCLQCQAKRWWISVPEGQNPPACSKVPEAASLQDARRQCQGAMPMMPVLHPETLAAFRSAISND